MKWKYNIPHYWESPEDRTLWEDVYLMPEDGSSNGKSYWFTLDALGSPAGGLPNGEEVFEPADVVRERNLGFLGDREYLITETFYMLIRAENFNQKELLEWAKVLIRDQFGDAEPILVEGSFAEFSDTNNHAAEIGRIVEAFDAGIPEDEIINYRQGTSDAPEG